MQLRKALSSVLLQHHFQYESYEYSTCVWTHVLSYLTCRNNLHSQMLPPHSCASSCETKILKMIYHSDHTYHTNKFSYLLLQITVSQTTIQPATNEILE